MFREEASSSLPSVGDERDFERFEAEISDEDRNPKHRALWRDIVGDESLDKTKVPSNHPRVAGSPRGRTQPTIITKPSPTKMFSREEVIELLKESKLNDGGNNTDGWTQVKSKATVKKATSQAREMLGVSKKKRKLYCWECKSSDHLSHHCPLGMSCHYCHQQGHRIADCPRYRPKVRMGSEIETEETCKEQGSYREERRRLQRVFLPLTEEVAKAKQEALKLTGILVSGFGQPSIEEMIEGLKAMSDRLSKFRWRPYRSGKDLLVEFPDERTLTFFSSRASAIPCPKGSFRVFNWKGTEKYQFRMCKWIALMGLPPFVWSRTTMAEITKPFGQLIELDTATEEKTRIDRARLLIGCDELNNIPEEIEVVLGGDLYRITVEIENPIKKRIDFRPSPELRQPTAKTLEIFRWAKVSNQASTTGQHSKGTTHAPVQANSTIEHRKSEKEHGRQGAVTQVRASLSRDSSSKSRDGLGKRHREAWEDGQQYEGGRAIRSDLRSEGKEVRAPSTRGRLYFREISQRMGASIESRAWAMRVGLMIVGRELIKERR